MRKSVLAALAAATFTMLMPLSACMAAPDVSGKAGLQWSIYRSNKGGKPYPPAVAKLVTEGLSLLADGKWQAGTAKFDKALKLMPNTAGLYQMRGSGHLEGGQFDDALDDFNKALSLDPDMALIIYWNRADCYNAMNKPDLALAEYTRSLALNPGDEQRAAMLLSRGRLLVDQGQPERATQDFTQVTAFPPLRAQAYSELSYLAAERGDMGTCIDLASNAIKANPKYYGGWMNRSTCEIAKRKFSAALNDLDAAIQLEPDWPEAYLNRAQVNAELHDCRKANEDAEKAIQIAPASEKQAHNITAECR